MRMRNKPWARGYLEQSGRVVSAEGHKGLWREAFGNGGAIHVELGCGKGGFVIQMAEMHPAVNFVAIERDANVLAAAAKAAEAAQAGNVLFAEGDAARVTEYFAAGEAERLYINFCDPWRNRAKWFRRRLTHRGFLGLYRQILAPGGALRFKTDNTDLFRFSVRELTADGWRLENVTEDLRAGGFEGDAQTEYERRFVEMGRRICGLEAYAGVQGGDQLQ